MLLSTKEKKTQPIIMSATDETALAEGARKCVIYRTLDPGTGQVRCYHGGGLYSKDKRKLTLWLDYLRPNCFEEFDAEEFTYLKFDGIALDILCKNGMWISSIVTPKIKLAEYSFRYLRFDDKRVLSVCNGVAVVDLPMTDISPADINRITTFFSPDPEVLSSLNPLTIAYTRQGNSIYIGYWDTVEGKFKGRPKKYWASLDIGL